MMQDGILTARSLVLGYLERIARIDQSGVRLNSVLEVNPDALHIADSLDRERRTKGPRGPLHGIPILVKDNIDTGDKMHTSAGSVALAESYAPEDSMVAQRLRSSGAIILGKANMTEWANFMTTGMPGGYSSRGGQVLNPYGPGKFSPGGSSAGSGAATAANLAMAAIGTETSGSILSPASNNSLVGIKPTVGSVSRYGIIPIMHTQDTAGPLARTVADAAILFSALVAQDERDPVTLSTETHVHADYAKFCDSGALSGARLGVPRGLYAAVDPELVAVIDKAIAMLRDLGAAVLDPVEMPCAGSARNQKAMVFEFKPNLNHYLSRLSGQVSVHNLRELIEFNAKWPGMMLRFGQSLLIESEATSGHLTEPAYIEALADGIYQSTERGIDYCLKHYNLDALILAGNWGANVAARAGYPSVTVPAGYAANSLPIGVTFTAEAWSEPKLIALAYAFEQATHLRRPPTLSSKCC